MGSRHGHVPRGYPRLWADPVYRADAEALLATCRSATSVSWRSRPSPGVLDRRAPARRVAAGDPATDARWADSWYEPVSGDAIREACRSRLSTPGCTRSARPATRGLLPDVLTAATAYRAPPPTCRDVAVAAMADEAGDLPHPSRGWRSAAELGSLGRRATAPTRGDRGGRAGAPRDGSSTGDQCRPGNAAATADSAHRRAIGHPRASPAARHPPRPPGDRVGHRVGAEQRAVPSSTTRPPATAASSPKATQLVRLPSRPWPVIDTQTEGPCPRPPVGVDPEVLEGPRPRRLDHDVGTSARSRASPATAGEGDRSTATDACPRLSRSKKRVAHGAHRRDGGRLHLHHPVLRRPPTGEPGRADPPTANRARRRPSPPGWAWDGPRPTSDVARVGAAWHRPGPASPRRATGRPSRRPWSTTSPHERPLTATLIARHGSSGGPSSRTMRARAPRRRRASDTATHPSRAGRRRVAPPTLMGPRRWRPAIAAGPRGPGGRRRAQRPLPPPPAGQLLAKSGQAGHEARRRSQRLTIGASGERHGTARRPCFELDAWIQRGSAIGEGVHGATMIARHPAVRLRHGCASHAPRRPGRLRPIGRCAARGGLATRDGRCRPRPPGGRRAKLCRGGGRLSSSALLRAGPRWQITRRATSWWGPTATTSLPSRATVASNPLASTSLTTLLRVAGVRAASEGLLLDIRGVLRAPGRPRVRGVASGRPVRERSTPAVRRPCRADGDELRIELDRPEVRNALGVQLRDQLVEAFAVAEADPTLRVVLSGAGPSFCSGGDLDEFGSFPIRHRARRPPRPQHRCGVERARAIARPSTSTARATAPASSSPPSAVE